MKLGVQYLEHYVGEPLQYATEGSSGFDLRAAIKEPITVELGHNVIVPTGIKISIPEGYEVQIRPRSGLAAKYGLTVVNTPGTIDADYRGEVKVILTKVCKGVEEKWGKGKIGHSYVIEPGDRIAQAVVVKVEKVVFHAVSTLDETERGTGGFGSTGKQ